MKTKLIPSVLLGCFLLSSMPVLATPEPREAELSQTVQRRDRDRDNEDMKNRDQRDWRNRWDRDGRDRWDRFGNRLLRRVPRILFNLFDRDRYPDPYPEDPNYENYNYRRVRICNPDYEQKWVAVSYRNRRHNTSNNWYTEGWKRLRRNECAFLATSLYGNHLYIHALDRFGPIQYQTRVRRFCVDPIRNFAFYDKECGWGSEQREFSSFWLPSTGWGTFTVNL